MQTPFAIDAARTYLLNVGADKKTRLAEEAEQVEGEEEDERPISWTTTTWTKTWNGATTKNDERQKEGQVADDTTVKTGLKGRRGLCSPRAHSSLRPCG